MRPGSPRCADRASLRLALLAALALATCLAGPCRDAAWAAPAETAPANDTVEPAASQQSHPLAGTAPDDTTDPSPAHVEAARQLILATGISRSFQIIIPEFMDQIGMTLSQNRPELVADLTTVLTGLKPEFDRQAVEMIDLSARIYAHLLSEADIRAILAFFKSDAGNKYVNAQPLFLNQLVAGMQAWQQKISVAMMTRVREEMKKKGHDL